MPASMDPGSGLGLMSARSDLQWRFARCLLPCTVNVKMDAGDACFNGYQQRSWANECHLQLAGFCQVKMCRDMLH